MKALLVAYHLNPQANPVLQGRSGVVYAKNAVHNPNLRRFELSVDLHLLREHHLDIFNNLRRAGAQWILADIDLGAEAGELALALQGELDKCRATIGLLKPRAERAASLERTLSDLNAQAAANAEFKTGALIPRAELEAATDKLAKQETELFELRAAVAVAGHAAIDAAAGGPPPPVTDLPPTIGALSGPPSTLTGPMWELRGQELEPKSYRELRAIALDDDHKIELPPNPSKAVLLKLILDKEFVIPGDPPAPTQEQPPEQ